MIGVRGVDALFARSLHLTSTAFPWLVIAGDDPSSAELPVMLAARLAGRGPDAAAAAGHALLDAFVALLASLVGDSLTDRLLSPVGAPLATAPTQETTP